MPELPETSALLRVHPARAAADGDLMLSVQVLLLPSYQCCDLQQC